MVFKYRTSHSGQHVTVVTGCKKFQKSLDKVAQSGSIRMAVSSQGHTRQKFMRLGLARGRELGVVGARPRTVSAGQFCAVARLWGTLSRKWIRALRESSSEAVGLVTACEKISKNSLTACSRLL
jgi:hypothetical protein